MENYKPGWMGKVMPVDNPSKLTDFVKNKYDAFSKVYDTCKDQSAQISDIKTVESGSGDSETLSVKISADKETVDAIKETAKDDPSISVKGDVVTAKGDS